MAMRYANLVAVIEVFHVFEPIKCEKCRKVIAEPKELIDFYLSGVQSF